MTLTGLIRFWRDLRRGLDTPDISRHDPSDWNSERGNLSMTAVLVIVAVLVILVPVIQSVLATLNAASGGLR